jgi:hypothetical protein
MKTAKNTGVGFILVLLVCFTVICACTEEKAGNPSENGDNNIKSQEETLGEIDVKDETPEGEEVKDGTFPVLDAETEKRILQDYFDTRVKPEDPEATVNNIRIERYCGTYNGVVAAKFTGFFVYADVVWGEVIAGLQFYYPEIEPVFAWKDGSLYRLREAYDLGLLTGDDIKSIHEIYRGVTE